MQRFWNWMGYPPVSFKEGAESGFGIAREASSRPGEYDIFHSPQTLRNAAPVAAAAAARLPAAPVQAQRNAYLPFQRVQTRTVRPGTIVTTRLVLNERQGSNRRYAFVPIASKGIATERDQAVIRHEQDRLSYTGVDYQVRTQNGNIRILTLYHKILQLIQNKQHDAIVQLLLQKIAKGLKPVQIQEILERIIWETQGDFDLIDKMDADRVLRPHMKIVHTRILMILKIKDAVKYFHRVANVNPNRPVEDENGFKIHFLCRPDFYNDRSPKHLELLESVLKSGRVDVNRGIDRVNKMFLRKNVREHPLMVAIRFGNVPAYRLLRQYGANVHVYRSPEMRTLFHEFADAVRKLGLSKFPEAEYLLEDLLKNIGGKVNFEERRPDGKMAYAVEILADTNAYDLMFMMLTAKPIEVKTLVEPPERNIADIAKAHGNLKMRDMILGLRKELGRKVQRMATFNEGLKADEYIRNQNVPQLALRAPKKQNVFGKVAEVFRPNASKKRAKHEKKLKRKEDGQVRVATRIQNRLYGL